MTRWSKRRRGWSLLCFPLAPVAAVAGVSAAAAQELPEVISPLRVDTDINGVNLVTGRIDIQGPVLAAPGASNLRFDGAANAAPYVTGRADGTGVEGGVVAYSIHTGSGSAEGFRCDAGCASVTETGSTFNANSLVQAGTGVRWNFRHKAHDTLTAPNGSSLYYVETVNYPNGETLDWSYDWVTAGMGRVYRPARIDSSLGYFITISYQSANFPDNEWFALQTVSLYRRGNPAILINRLTYSGNTITESGNTAADTSDDRVYTCTGCTEGETWSGSLTLPGETVPTLQVTPISATERVAGIVTRDGLQWTYIYGNLRRAPNTSNIYWYDTLTVTGPEGYRRVYTMTVRQRQNIADAMTETVTTGGITRSFDYEIDWASRPTRIVYPEGNQVEVVYGDDYGNITSRTTTPELGSGQAAVTESALYRSDCSTVPSARPCYRPLWSRDGLGRQTDFLHDDNGLLTQRTDPADREGVRRTTTIEYEATTPSWALGPIIRRSAMTVCGTGAACGTGAQIRTEYDYADGTYGLLLLPSVERRVAGSQSLETRYTYDAAGNVLTVDGPLTGTGDAAYFRYDAHGRRIREVGPLGANGVRIVQLHHYRNSDSKLTRTETGTVVNPDDVPTELRQVDYGYDARRNLVRETVTSTNTAGGTVYHSVVQRKYDDRNRVECEARRMNPTQLATGNLPASACDRDSTGSFGYDRITRSYYDSAGQLLRVQRGYDTPLVQNYAVYSYTPNGQRASVTDANGNRAELRFDGFDRLSRWVFPSPTTDGVVNEADYEEYRYDAVGNRTWLRKRDASVLTYQYDALNRMIRKTVPDRAGLDATHERDIFYDYNVRDLMTDARFDSWSGEGAGYGYDGFGRMSSSSLNMDGVTRRFTYAWDAAGNRTQVTYPNNNDFAYAWDSAGRLTGITDADAAEQLFSFSYDGLGRLDIRTDPGAGGIDHNFDRVDRLTSMAHTFAGGTGNVTYGFTYNPAGQIATRTRSNDAYAWTGGVDVDRGYETNGLNQYRRTLTSSGTTATAFGYDANGNLTASGSTSYTYDVENRLVGASGGRVLRYDPLGRLYEATGASGTRRFIWDGDALAVEYQTSGALAATFVHGSGSGDDPLLWRGGGENRRLHSDHQGSIVAITNDAGTANWINGYDEWGIPNPTNAGRFQYTGQIWLGDFGFYHYKARIYSPTLGRFLQVDPVGYDDQVNLYAYVGNDPVNRVDPRGTDALWVSNPDGTTTLIIPVRFSGSGATAANVAAIVNRANSLAISNPNYRIQVVQTRTAMNGVLNNLDFSPGKNTSLCGSVGECINRLGGDNGHIDSSSNEAIAAAAHDILHFAGIQDRYVEGPADANGNRTSTPSPGYNDRNIMTSRTGTDLTPGQFEEGRSNQSTKQCTVEIGSRIPVCR